MEPGALIFTDNCSPSSPFCFFLLGGQLLVLWHTAAPPTVCRLLTYWVDKHLDLLRSAASVKLHSMPCPLGTGIPCVRVPKQQKCPVRNTLRHFNPALSNLDELRELFRSVNTELLKVLTSLSSEAAHKPNTFTSSDFRISSIFQMCLISGWPIASFEAVAFLWQEKKVELWQTHFDLLISILFSSTAAIRCVAVSLLKLLVDPSDFSIEFCLIFSLSS